MSNYVVLLSLPAVREKDLEKLPALASWVEGGGLVSLRPGFPAVTCTVQANMTTGLPPREHGIIANGLYDRNAGRAEMWTSPNTAIERPQIWETLRQEAHARGATFSSATWFPMHCKQTRADYACTPAPIHNPDGSESLWCYTKPTELYGQLRDRLGHFPLQHFWGPMTHVKASEWIIESAVLAAGRWKPNLFYLYLPHLDYQAQRHGPDSPQASEALTETNSLLERLMAGMRAVYTGDPTWIIAGEYAVTPVDTVCYPNRSLREAGLLQVVEQEDGELLDPKASAAWAMADHQVAHVFVNDPARTGEVADLFENAPGVAEVLAGPAREKYALDHERSGEVVLVAEPGAWFAYYWWLDDARAPGFARTVDIHRKPGFDPVELFFDPATRSIPLDASLVRGSHGAPAVAPEQHSVLVVSEPSLLQGQGTVADTDVFQLVRRAAGL